MDDTSAKVVLVTGAGQACGRAIALDMAARGASVVVDDLDADNGAQTAEMIRAAGGTAHFVHADVRVEAEVEAMVQTCVDVYGRLDIAVNNAGTEAPVAVVDSTDEQFAGILASNLQALRSCLVHEIAAMRANDDGGAILNMGSVTSDITAAPNNALYAATKGGVDALTKGTAVEVAADGISINALAFIAADVENGMFQRFLADTPLTQEQILAGMPIGRLLAAEELCAAVRYLTSDEARFVVGTTLVLDGGFTSL